MLSCYGLLVCLEGPFGPSPGQPVPAPANSPAAPRLSPTQGELVSGGGRQLIVLTTRTGEISIVQP